MLGLRLIVPALPLLLIGVTQSARVIVALKQMKEIRRIREILEENLGPVTVKDKE